MERSGDKTSRRTFLKAGTGIIGTMAVGLEGRRASGTAPAKAPRPNFIFVTTDGHRPDALSLNGNRIVQTPNFDRIGREGIQFRNSFVTNALCLPSRAAVLTGLYGHSTGCVDNKNLAIPKEVPLFTDLLRDAGYEVALLGKAHGRSAKGTGIIISVIQALPQTTSGRLLRKAETERSANPRRTRATWRTWLRTGQSSG